MKRYIVGTLASRLKSTLRGTLRDSACEYKFNVRGVSAEDGMQEFDVLTMLMFRGLEAAFGIMVMVRVGVRLRVRDRVRLRHILGVKLIEVH